MRKYVFCKLSFVGLHCWETCPDESDVSYLKNRHRHVFGVECVKEVSHSDRDIEFITLKQEVQQYIDAKYKRDGQQTCDLGSKSCEMIAEEILTEFGLTRCIVDEDGENGAIVTA